MNGVAEGEFVDWRSPIPEDSGPSAVEQRAESRPDGESLGRFGQENWELPGYGESGPGCGEWYPGSVCDGCGHVEFGTRSCGRRTCPDCWGLWAKESAARIAQRIQEFRYTQPDDHRRQAAHAVVELGESIRTEREFWKGRKKAAEIAEAKGWRGFAVIGHPWRPTDEAKEAYQAVEREVGIWVWLRNEVEGDIHEFTKWAPHYHVLGVTGQDMEGAKESDEFAYHFIRSLDRFHGPTDRNSHEDVFGAARYLLSHTGYPEGSTKQATTWYGALANSVFVEEATEEWQNEKPRVSVRERIEREIEAVTAADLEDDEEGGGSEDCDDCGECPECDDGVLIDVFDVDQYLRQCDPPPEVTERMQAARDWRLGRVLPPPGMQRPQTEEQAREAFEELL